MHNVLKSVKKKNFQLCQEQDQMMVNKTKQRSNHSINADPQIIQILELWNSGLR